MQYDFRHTIHGDILHFVINGTHSVEAGIHFAKEVVRIAEQHELQKVLVDMSSFKVPLDIGSIYLSLSRPTAEVQSLRNLKHAFVMDRALHDQDGLFQTIARNQGLNLRTFDTVDEAMHWLQC